MTWRPGARGVVGVKSILHMCIVPLQTEAGSEPLAVVALLI
jgi:hypothetical protein